MKINDAKFVITVADGNKLLETEFPEFAFVGRSNVGKSTLINALTNRNKLAKASSTPGKTKHVNYFLINNNFYIVDLPGYGYHKASKADAKRWRALIEDYLTASVQLKCVFVLMDIRHKPSEQDKQMLTFLNYYKTPYVIIATKGDKLSQAQRGNYVSKLAQEVGLTKKDILTTSSSKKLGMDLIANKMDQFMGQDPDSDE